MAISPTQPTTSAKTLMPLYIHQKRLSISATRSICGPCYTPCYTPRPPPIVLPSMDMMQNFQNRDDSLYLPPIITYFPHSSIASHRPEVLGSSRKAITLLRIPSTARVSASSLCPQGSIAEVMYIFLPLLYPSSMPFAMPVLPSFAERDCDGVVCGVVCSGTWVMLDSGTGVPASCCSRLLGWAASCWHVRGCVISVYLPRKRTSG